MSYLYVCERVCVCVYVCKSTTTTTSAITEYDCTPEDGRTTTEVNVSGTTVSNVLCLHSICGSLLQSGLRSLVLHVITI